MRSRVIKIMIALITLVLVIMAFMSWYTNQYSMDIIVSYEVNNPQSRNRVLIATQGSEFKKELTQNIVSHLKSRPIYINVIDVTALPTIKQNEWDAIVIIHTWEYLLPQKNAQLFVDQLTNTDNLVAVTTSGLGKKKLEKINGISSASISSEVDLVTSQVVQKVERLLKNP